MRTIKSPWRLSNLPPYGAQRSTGNVSKGGEVATWLTELASDNVAHNGEVVASDLVELKKLALAVDVDASSLVMMVSSSPKSEKIRSESGDVEAEENRW